MQSNQSFIKAIKPPKAPVEPSKHMDKGRAWVRCNKRLVISTQS